ncbi:hypothetical protein [Acinetobacter proteolyticus]|uniref:hypothetical protein n=1 Tax=Acinetobacter proteolyticus TaxID=1776741 RepID=UPI0012FEE319|nr:hypothetical protein [Acinetobacter proteolyticus]
MELSDLKAACGVEFFKIHRLPEQTIASLNMDIREAPNFIKKTKADFVLVRQVSIIDKIREVVDDFNNKDEFFIRVLKKAQDEVLELINNHPDSSNDQYKRLIEEQKQIESFVNSNILSEIIEYEIFIPFQGLNYTFGNLKIDWKIEQNTLIKARRKVFSESLKSLLK